MPAASPSVVWALLALFVLGAVAWFALRWARRHEERLRRAGQVEFDSTMVQQQQEMDLLRSQARAAESRLREVIDVLPVGIAIYDNQDRLLAVNGDMARQYPAGEAPAIGEPHEALARRAPLQQRLGDGPWVQVRETRTPSGYLVVTRLDLAPLVEKGLALERANEQMLRLSTIDGLIGIANRRQFDLTLQNEWQRCARNQSSLALLVIDIDHFKRYNDHYGHLAGDECLRQVARVLGLCVKRSGELVARFGGEEFAVLLPGTDAPEARRVAQRCLYEMLNARIPHADSPVSPCLTVSIGAAAMVAGPGLSPTALVDEALSALARAKEAGRSRVEVVDPSPVSAPASLPAPL